MTKRSIKLTDLLEKNPEWETSHTNGKYIKRYEVVVPFVQEGRKYDIVPRINNLGLGWEDSTLESAFFRELQKTLKVHSYELSDKSIPLAQNDGCQARFRVKDVENSSNYLEIDLFGKYIHASPDFLSELLKKDIKNDI